MIHVKAMCIITHKGRVLATKGLDEIKGESFFRLIGGGVHFQELAHDALKREVREELETELGNIAFLQVIENIFVHRDEPGHEVIFLFSADMVRKELYEKEEIHIADHLSVVAVWVPFADILSGAARLYPATDYTKYLVPL